MPFSILFLLSILLSSCNRQSIPESTSISLTTPSSASHTVSATTTQDISNINFAYQNSQISFDIPIQNPVVTRQDDSSVTFASVKKDIEFRYKTLANGLKEEIILNQPSSTNQFKSRVKITNSDIYQTSDNTLIFYDSSTQEYLYHFQPPFAIDSKGVRTDNVTFQLYQDDKLLTVPPTPTPSDKITVNFTDTKTKLGTGSDFTLLVTVDPSWLSDPARSYPITIDPSIITDPYTSTAFIDTGASTNYQVTGGQLRINPLATPCWGTVNGTCNSGCNYDTRTFVGSPGYNSYSFYSTYVSYNSCSGSVGNSYYASGYGGCSSQGFGSCYVGSYYSCTCIYYYSSHTTSCSPSGGTAASATCSFFRYNTSSLVQSTNLLDGISSVTSIDSFRYNLATKPSGTYVGVKFSQDASTWVNSAGIVGASDTLVVGGTNPVNLAGLGWSGPSFYYQLNFLSTGVSTPTLNDITLDFTMPNATKFKGVQMKGVKIN